ncbi:MFS transporter [uncultured Paraglaciecola sp.]|uniref:MFS transporter n=1 Tax=uncultured Paraglaciecola sp. TaxID=1765024 RepID=UPI0025E4DB77|nr:MFS transporter [uncultured Paraglaciecola sp.]
MNLNKHKIFTQLISIATCGKLADLLISAKTTLPWLLASLGAPIWIVSMLVPIRESGSLIPQWPLKQKVRHIENRLIIWRWGIAIQACSICFMLASAIFTEALLAGLLILLCLLLLSLGRSLSSLSMKDVQGLNIKKGQRGQLVGIASTMSGLLSLITAGLMIISPQDMSIKAIQLLITFSAFIMFISLILSIGLIANLTDNKKDSNDGKSIWKIINQQADLKQLILSRCLLLHAALIAPFFVSTSATNNDFFQLPYFIIANALASFLSSYSWGKMADKSAIRTMFYATLVCVSASIMFYFVTAVNNWWVDVFLFFVLNLGYAGIRIGRKTYMLDIAQGSQRTLYVAAANSVVGYVLLILGGSYALLYIVMGEHVIIVMTFFMAIGLIHTFKMKKEK